MARIPDSEIERIKRETDLVALVQAAGVELRRHGANLVGRCPLHDDQGPSLVVTPSKNLWHCMGACQAGGSVIDWVMRTERVSFRHAVELLRVKLGAGDPTSSAPAVSLAPIAEKATDAEAIEDAALVREVIDFYHETLKASPEAIAYLEQRGLNSVDLIDRFRLGYANRTLAYRLPGSRWKAGATLRTRLQRLGFIRESGHEHFRGSIVVPIFGERGQLAQAYARKIGAKLREGTPAHLYLPGPHTTVWNVDALASSKEIILCESLFDALTFWAAGFRHVITSYGVGGFTFRRRTLEGEIAGAELRDWPIGYAELEPYYEEVERDLQIAGPTFYPWGPRRTRYPQREHDLNACAKLLVTGCTKLGIPVAPAPIATLSAPHRDRVPCIYRGFCNYGCTTNAKSSVLVTYVLRAIRAGAEVRPNAMVARIEHNEHGLVTGVLYFRDGGTELHRQRARNVVVAGYAVETPRLLLNSASSMFPDGLANSSGCVGRYFMVHTGDQVFAKFPERINQYKAPPPGGAITEHFNRTMPEERFVCGYTIEVVGPHVVDFASRIASSRGLWGAALRREMLDYNYWSGLGIVGEVLPQRDNRVELYHEEKDRYGLPIPRVVFGYHRNDREIVEHAVGQMTRILEAAGGTDCWHADRTAHLLGGCRMGDDADDSVVNADCRSHDIPNLWVCDGSVYPTSAAVNPSLTIQAIASRTAARIRELAARRELAR